ncbi:MAG: DUF2927 domain-containing protein [Rhizobiales bacterium]|nr:DUF2927 domain-containing protein [Hyphomicrobiales bacterium]
MTFGEDRRAKAPSGIIKARRWTAYGGAIVVAVSLAVPTLAADNPKIAHHRATERKTFTNAEIADGFFKVTFGAEFHVAGGVDRIRKYDKPVRVYVDNRAKPDRTQQVAAVIADLRARIRDLDIVKTEQRDEAQIVVSLVHDRDLARMIRTLYGIDRARRIQRSLEPQCLSGFRKDEHSRILHSDVLIVADAGDFVFYDCIYEEMLQALGPINDDTTVPWTMFNDDVRMGFFDLYDQYLLNILYDQRIKPGMTRAEVEKLLPEILPQVRAWVDENNKPGP